jgi:steroid 5-alpha reductase family enzyme
VSPFLIAAVALVVCCGVFAGFFRVARRLDNYGIVDIVWSYAFGLVALVYAALADGWAPRRWLVAVLVVFWSLRLGTYLFRRVMGHHPFEDGRYREMRVRWAADFAREMARFYQLQAVSVVILATPFLLALGRPESGFTVLDFVAIALFAVSLVGESVADAQLAAFKRDPANQGRVCEAGLWAWSRHPNYFFVWLSWVSFAVFAWPAAWGWLGLIAPACILYLLIFVTGIPMTEEQAVRTKGDAYRDYQRRVSAFVPWFPKRRIQNSGVGIQ